MASPRRVLWDAPLRLFHWTLAVLAVFSFVTGTVGVDWMPWHLRSGYAILALLVFRLAWGFVGGTTARFAHFIRGPRAALEHARALVREERPVTFGHNPLGAWMVVAMLLALLFQAVTGLFADDELRTQGPLAVKVSEAMVSRMSALHSWNRWVVAALVAVHVIAIALYQWRWKIDVFWPMVSGRREAGGAHEPETARPGSNLLALGLIVACAFAVYWLVVIYPRP